MKTTAFFSALLVSLSVTSILFAQDSVPNLQDLIDVKGGSAEGQMERRGYRWVHTVKSNNSADSYWRESLNGRCVAVRTTDGRYASIAYTQDIDCIVSNQGNNEQEHDGQGDGFETVCGVIVDGKSYRYRCNVDDTYEGDQKTKTLLHFPDQTMELQWQPNNEVLIRQKDLKDRTAHYSTLEGETNFRSDGNTYFYISNRDAARLEVENFRN